ncbi:tRNA 5-methoxyuridine(34)/uridine 5-oxyacetic acid(34) synthase CmoB [Helicobacter didelphidarum]|nr:tRNA 5-methoxyuridine(34)/uridine 5-oxyacetic acid(34) synthase CmoB [Helicobacter didelphidarum]
MAKRGFEQDKHINRENGLQNQIKSLSNNPIFDDFTQEEFAILNNHKNLEMLQKISTIQFNNRGCFSILDSKISNFIFCHSQTDQRNHHNKNADIQTIEKTKNTRTIPLRNDDVNTQPCYLEKYNGFHIFLDTNNKLIVKNNYIDSKTNNEIITKDSILSLINDLKPWRKGPFYIHYDDTFFQNILDKDFENPNLFTHFLSSININPNTIQKNTQQVFKVSNDHQESLLHIDTEWQSHIKMKLILESLQTLHYDIANKEILDVGCNNGYYMFDLALRAKHITGIDPVGIFFLQFFFIYQLTRTVQNRGQEIIESYSINNISFRLLGVQDLSRITKKFDLILCLGVLYHRQDPLQTLKILKQSLKKDGLLLLETLIIQTQDEYALCPYPTYAKMSNVFYIFSPKALCNLALRAGFKTCDLLSFSYTTTNEQRTTDFIQKQSLGDFLQHDHTIEGYPPACRGIFALYS